MKNTFENLKNFKMSKQELVNIKGSTDIYLIPVRNAEGKIHTIGCFDYGSCSAAVSFWEAAGYHYTEFGGSPLRQI